MKKYHLKTFVVIILLATIISLFAYFIHDHPQIITSLKHTSPWLIIILLLCYGLMMLWWMKVYNATLSLCGEPLKNKDNMLLTIYSTLANFFLPLQSGPGVRAAYLKKQHKVPVYSYLLASLLYFAIYAMISAGFLFIASSFWWLALPAIILTAIISYFVITIAKKQFEKKTQPIKLDLSKNKIIKLVAFTLAQLTTQGLIYGIELNSLHPVGISIRRVLSYTGAANFSLFVSLTPGAIGFREAFLEFSRQLHHFTTFNIIAANIIDRGVFLIFLVILFIIMIITHAKDKLKI
jgi:uncharacterized membrane protein YbhN (UPF0104 family)